MKPPILPRRPVPVPSKAVLAATGAVWLVLGIVSEWQANPVVPFTQNPGTLPFACAFGVGTAVLKAKFGVWGQGAYLLCLFGAFVYCVDARMSLLPAFILASTHQFAQLALVIQAEQT